MNGEGGKGLLLEGVPVEVSNNHSTLQRGKSDMTLTL